MEQKLKDEISESNADFENEDVNVLTPQNDINIDEKSHKCNVCLRGSFFGKISRSGFPGSQGFHVGPLKPLVKCFHSGIKIGIPRANRSFA